MELLAGTNAMGLLGGIDLRITRDTFRNSYNWLIIVLLVLNLLPILAPLLMSAGLELAAKPIYFFYSFTCHQFAHRSLHINDHQCAWCSRDMAIWGSFLLVAVLVKYRGVLKGLKWYWVIPFTVPIAMDGGIQTIATMVGINSVTGAGDPFYISTNVMRAITGSIFGIGMGLWIFPNLFSALKENIEAASELTAKRIDKARLMRYTVFITISIFASYLSILAVWGITSNRVLPANALDFQVKTPLNREFFLRRENGACPTNAISEDPLALDCFFGALAE